MRDIGDPSIWSFREIRLKLAQTSSANGEGGGGGGRLGGISKGFTQMVH